MDPGETPLDASLRELKEETGYTGTHMNVRMKTLFHLLAGLVDSVLFGSVEKQERQRENLADRAVEKQ